jgi:hypothetical protein
MEGGGIREGSSDRMATEGVREELRAARKQLQVLISEYEGMGRQKEREMKVAKELLADR